MLHVSRLAGLASEVYVDFDFMPQIGIGNVILPLPQHDADKKFASIQW